MERYVKEERHVREENLRLQRKLQLEVERREALCRHLSESESRYVVFIQGCHAMIVVCPQSGRLRKSIDLLEL